jgi:MerR family transcriptional regulator, light-induced transcriptional regulator
MASQPISKKPLFNLNLVVQETGIKPDTLRAWERRYELPTPSRTEGGHRLFSQYDIETIKWLISRQNEGMRISQAVDYWRELIAAGKDPLEENLRGSLPVDLTPADIQLKPLNELRTLWIEHCLAFEEEKAERVLDTAFTQYPWESVLTDLIFPGMAEIGEGWYASDISVQQEHYASELVARKLQALIDSAPQSFHPQKALIGCPAGEFHTIAPLALNLLLRYRGWEIIYLGADVPLTQLEESLNSIQPSLVIMTAAMLKTCAALLDASQSLREQGIPLAYSGHVFTEIPQLIDRIPGTYLGSDLEDAVAKIEKLLSDPEPSTDPPPPPNPYQDLIEQIVEQLPYLESAVLFQSNGEKQLQVPLNFIREVNKYLFDDMVAALKLGDIRLLKPNISWVKGLLQSRGLEPELLQEYLENFIDVTRNNLGEDADPLLDWMGEYTAKLTQNENNA